MKSYINFTLFGIDIGWGLTEIPFDISVSSVVKQQQYSFPFIIPVAVVVHILIRQKSPDMTKRQKNEDKNATPQWHSR